jgi:hypothetical protein
MAIVDTPRTFRDALDGVMGEHSVGQTDDTVRKIERCVAWRELVAETIYRLVGSLLEAGAQEQEVAEQMAHPPVPTWSTTELAATQSGTSGLAQFRPLEVGLTGALPHPGELALGDSELLRQAAALGLVGCAKSGFYGLVHALGQPGRLRSRTLAQPGLMTQILQDDAAMRDGYEVGDSDL